ncbi:MAG: hypothetical protein L0387_03890 [Acidobacteria bacterium]|nr:hypothetical protein [Acidobacteriota bacterium]
MANQIAEQFPSENGVSPEERGTSTRPFLIAQPAAAGPKENPWSKYAPFLKGTELQVEGSALAIPFKGTGKVDEQTDAQLNVSVSIPIDIPFIDRGTIFVEAKITYTGEGGSNLAVFSINGRESKRNINIQSKQNERILTAPGGLEISTGIAFPDKVTLNVVHMRPTKDRVEIEAQFADLTPTATIQVSKKPAAPARTPT